MERTEVSEQSDPAAPKHRVMQINYRTYVAQKYGILLSFNLSRGRLVQVIPHPRYLHVWGGADEARWYKLRLRR